MFRVDVGYLEDRRIDLEGSTKDSLIELILNLELFLYKHDLFSEFYPED